MTRGVLTALVTLVLAIAHGKFYLLCSCAPTRVFSIGDCQCQQNFAYPGANFNQDHAIIYDISTCLRCEENSFTILVAGSGVSPAPLTNSNPSVAIIPPVVRGTQYTLMIPVPRDVLSNTADTVIGCGSEDIRFSELGKLTCYN